MFQVGLHIPLKLRLCRAGDGNDEIYVMDADGRNPVNLTNLMGRIAPDGEKIGFFLIEEDNLISVMGADGANVVNLTCSCGPPMMDCLSVVARQIYVMDADGHESPIIRWGTGLGDS